MYFCSLQVSKRFSKIERQKNPENLSTLGTIESNPLEKIFVKYIKYKRNFKSKFFQCNKLC